MHQNAEARLLKEILADDPKSFAAGNAKKLLEQIEPSR